MLGIDLTDPSNSPIVVFFGLLIGQLFLYGKKVKNNIKIAGRELIGDLMQFATQFVGAMGLLAIGRGMGWNLNDVWQVVTITILFTMTFDQWFGRLRAAFTDRMGAAADALLGKAPTEGVMRVPAGDGVPSQLDVTLLNDKIGTDELVAELVKRGVPLMELVAKAKMPTPDGPLTPDANVLDQVRQKAQIPPVPTDDILGALDQIPGSNDLPKAD